LNGKIYTHVVDVRDPKAVDEWITAVMKNEKVLHGAANVAGIGGGYHATDIANIVPIMNSMLIFRCKRTGTLSWA
jgi:hypothetical protein